MEDITDYEIYDLNDQAYFSGISAQIKSSDEYLHPENQSQISMSTDIEDYRILKPDRPRAIWRFDSKMSQVAYITDTPQLIGSKSDLKHVCHFLAPFFSFIH